MYETIPGFEILFARCLFNKGKQGEQFVARLDTLLQECSDFLSGF